MPSFDIVSEVEIQDIRHAVENAQRELETRFDFRGVDASFKWENNEALVKAETDFQCQQMVDILRNKLVKRGVDVNTMETGQPSHSGKTFTVKVGFKEGIDKELAKKVVKTIKDSKAKVQSSIQGEEIRVTGKKRDDLQGVIALLKGADLGQPLQFKNFRD